MCNESNYAFEKQRLTGDYVDHANAHAKENYRPVFTFPEAEGTVKVGA